MKKAGKICAFQTNIDPETREETRYWGKVENNLIRVDAERLDYTYFKEDGTTKCHVPGNRLYQFTAKWHSGVWTDDISTTTQQQANGEPWKFLRDGQNDGKIYTLTGEGISR